MRFLTFLSLCALVSLSHSAKASPVRASQEAVSPSDLEVGVSLHGFSYAEDVEKPKKSEESAFLREYYFSYTLPLAHPQWALRFRSGFSLQDTAYDGTDQTGKIPVTGTTKSTFLNLEALADFVISDDRRTAIYFGLGTNYWTRDLRSDGPVKGLRERYRWMYLPVGIRYQLFQSETFSILADASLRLNLGGDMDAVLTDIDPKESTVNLPLGPALGARVALPMSWKLSASWSVRVSPFFEYRPIGDGEPVAITGGAIKEPASTTLLYGVAVAPAFQF